jgi:NADH-quinone oxidoreductase subunit L
LGAPEYLWGSRWDHWLQPLFGGAEAHHGSVTAEIMVTVITLAIVSVAICLAYVKYGRTGAYVGASAGAGGMLYRLSLNKYYVDEIYDAIFVRPFTACSRFFAEFIDPWVIDGTVNGVAAAARGASSIWVGIQTGNVQQYLAAFLVGALALLAYCLGQV